MIHCQHSAEADAYAHELGTHEVREMRIETEANELIDDVVKQIVSIKPTFLLNQTSITLSRNVLELLRAVLNNYDDAVFEQAKNLIAKGLI